MGPALLPKYLADANVRRLREDTGIYLAGEESGSVLVLADEGAVGEFHSYVEPQFNGKEDFVRVGIEKGPIGKHGYRIIRKVFALDPDCTRTEDLWPAGLFPKRRMKEYCGNRRRYLIFDSGIKSGGTIVGVLSFILPFVPPDGEVKIAAIFDNLGIAHFYGRRESDVTAIDMRDWLEWKYPELYKGMEKKGLLNLIGDYNVPDTDTQMLRLLLK